MPTSEEKQTIELIVSKLKQGWELRNRGVGWWISAPRKAYQRTVSEPVSDETVNLLKSEGWIKTEVPGTSIIATLIKHCGE